MITNNVNGHRYIGKTNGSEVARFNRHCKLSEDGHTKFYRAIRKYGKESFSVSVLEMPENKDLNEREIHWISVLKPEYNMTRGGDGGDMSASPRYRAALADGRISVKGERNPMYGKRGELNPLWGTHWDDNAKANMSAAALKHRAVKKVCEHCGKSVDKPNFGRFHGDRCKSKLDIAKIVST